MLGYAKWKAEMRRVLESDHPEEALVLIGAVMITAVLGILAFLLATAVAFWFLLIVSLF